MQKKVYTQGDTHLDIDRIKSNLDLFTDIDECSIVPSVCDPNADCQNNMMVLTFARVSLVLLEMEKHAEVTWENKIKYIL